MFGKLSLRKFSFLAMSAFVLALGGASGVLAHNSLSASEPVDGATLDVAPTTWTLTFTGAVPLDSASAEVVLSDGRRVALPPAAQGASTSSIVFTLPEGLSGAVTGRWRLVGTDGHAITGRVQFTVTPIAVTTTIASTVSATTTTAPLEAFDGGSSTTVPAVEETVAENTLVEQNEKLIIADPASESVHWVLQATSYLGLILLGGLLFAEIALAHGILRRPRVILAVQAGSLALFITSALKSLVHVGDLKGVSLGSSFRHLGTLSETTAGSMLAVSTLIGFVLLMVTLSLDQRPRQSRFVKTLGVLVLLQVITMPFTGHSRSMRWPALGVPADIVHLLGMTIWAGGLLALVAFIMPAAQSSQAVIAYVRFSPYASGSVVAIVMTGVIQSARLHESVSSILDSSHGLTLLIKVLLVVVMLGVGWRSRRLLIADDGRHDIELRGRLIRATALEVGIGALVIGVSAALVRSTFSG